MNGRSSTDTLLALSQQHFAGMVETLESQEKKTVQLTRLEASGAGAGSDASVMHPASKVGTSHAIV